jgi:pimeloyl-ACP methyl ester carboxylesterase
MKNFYESNGAHLVYMDLSDPSDSPSGHPHDLLPPVVLIHGFASNALVNWSQTLWISTLSRAGYRVLAPDLVGHGESEKIYDPSRYHCYRLSEDVKALLDHCSLKRAHIMGYSLGARVAAHLARDFPEVVDRLVLSGLASRLVESEGLPMGIAYAMEAASLEELEDPQHIIFRKFAEQTQSDLRALSACAQGSRQVLTREDLARMHMPTLIPVGTEDDIAGSPEELAGWMPRARILPIPGADHQRAVGSRVHREGVLSFLGEDLRV